MRHATRDCAKHGEARSFPKSWATAGLDEENFAKSQELKVEASFSKSFFIVTVYFLWLRSMSCFIVMRYAYYGHHILVFYIEGLRALDRLVAREWERPDGRVCEAEEKWRCQASENWILLYH